MLWMDPVGRFSFNFLKGVSHCDWYSVLQYADLSTEYRGVNCDAMTGHISGFFLSKFLFRLFVL